jgi:predicted NBD/HSP70 family sugar kinase
MKLAIAIDIGGTSIKYALGNSNLELLERGYISTEAHKDRDSIFAKIFTIVNDLSTKAAKMGDSVCGVAIGSPGIVDPIKKRLINKSPNFHDWTEIDFHKSVEQQIKLPLFVENDANLAALGELATGEIDGSAPNLYMTVGTGIGSAILLNGQLYRGAALIAGEIGHMSINTRGIPCWCGSRGCWEKYASMAALKKRYLKEFQQKKTVAAILDELLAETEPLHRERAFRDAFFDDLAIGIQNIVQILNPRHIIIGGGAVEGHPKFVATVDAFVKARINEYAYTHLNIRKAVLGNAAALVGGVKVVFDAQN